MGRRPALMATTATILTPALLTAITDRHGSRTASLSAPVPGMAGDGALGVGVAGAAGAGDAVGTVEVGADAAFMVGALPDVALQDVASQDVASPVAARLEGFTVEAGSTAAVVFMAAVDSTVVAAVTAAEAVTGKQRIATIMA